MIIKKIKIKNFKTLKDFEIEPKPLTLLFGANSSGKSNFIRAMLFFKKNVLPLKEIFKDYNAGHLSYKLNENVDLISFEEVVSNGDISQKISFEFILDFSYLFPRNINKEIQLIFLHDFMSKEEIEGISLEKTNAEYLQANISVFFEFAKGKNKDYVSKIAFKDLNSKFNIDFDITENKYFAEVNWSECKQEVDKIFGINGNKISKSELPFFEIGFTRFIEKFESLKKDIVSDNNLPNKNINDENTLNKENKLKKIEQIKLYYLYSSLIPSLFQSFFSAIHFPQLREVPKKSYVLDDSKFGKNVYYNLLDSLYLHQSSLLDMLLRIKKENKVPENKRLEIFSLYSYIISQIREKLTDKDITEIFDHLKDYDEKGIFQVDKFNEFINNNKRIRQKEKRHFPAITKYETKCNKTEKKLLINLYKNNHYISGVYSYLYMFGCYFIPQFIRNLSLNTNNMILKMGFKGILYITKENDIGRINLITETRKKLNAANESSGFVQILPILIGLSLLKESYDFSNEEGGVFAFQNGIDDYTISFDFSKDLIKSLYIEQPELHMHPKLQSTFMDLLFKELINFNIHNSVFMETHSEHILKKIQIEVAKGNIDKKLVSILFFSNTDGKCIAENIKMNDVGQLEKEFPDGFFDDSINLTYEFYEAIKERK